MLSTIAVVSRDHPVLGQNQKHQKRHLAALRAPALSARSPSSIQQRPNSVCYRICSSRPRVPSPEKRNSTSNFYKKSKNTTKNHPNCRTKRPKNHANPKNLLLLACSGIKLQLYNQPGAWEHHLLGWMPSAWIVVNSPVQNEMHRHEADE